MKPLPKNLNLLGWSAVISKTCLSRTTLQGLIDAGEFPKPMRVGTMKLLFLEAEVNAWIEGLVAARDAGVGQEYAPNNDVVGNRVAK